jgi:hypothetical protein
MAACPIAIDARVRVGSTKGGEHDIRIAEPKISVTVQLVRVAKPTWKAFISTHQVLVTPPDPYTVVCEQLVHASQPVFGKGEVVVIPATSRTDDALHDCQRLPVVKR